MAKEDKNSPGRRYGRPWGWELNHSPFHQQILTWSQEDSRCFTGLWGKHCTFLISPESPYIMAFWSALEGCIEKNEEEKKDWRRGSLAVISICNKALESSLGCVITCRNGDGPWKEVFESGNRTYRAYLSQEIKKLASVMFPSSQWVMLQLSVSDKNKDYREGRRK